MAVKSLDSKLREVWMKTLSQMLTDAGEEVIQYKSNEICLPVVDEEGNEKWVQIVVKVPKGDRYGNEFDGYSMKEEYQLKLKEKEDKAKEKARKAEEAKKKREKRAESQSPA